MLVRVAAMVTAYQIHLHRCAVQSQSEHAVRGCGCAATPGYSTPPLCGEEFVPPTHAGQDGSLAVVVLLAHDKPNES